MSLENNNRDRFEDRVTRLKTPFYAVVKLETGSVMASVLSHSKDFVYTAPPCLWNLLLCSAGEATPRMVASERVIDADDEFSLSHCK